MGFQLKDGMLLLSAVWPAIETWPHPRRQLFTCRPITHPRVPFPCCMSRGCVLHGTAVGFRHAASIVELVQYQHRLAESKRYRSGDCWQTGGSAVHSTYPTQQRTTRISVDGCLFLEDGIQAISTATLKPKGRM
ncbi:hypothetical protein F4823DRAFT_594404, partial [Ustulina deusta]